MRLYADGDGRLIRAVKTDEEMAQYGAPDKAVYTLEVDAETNPQVMKYVDTAWKDVHLQDGALTYYGTPVPINPPSRSFVVRVEAADAADRLVDTIDGVLDAFAVALGHWDTLTIAEVKKLVRRLVEVQIQVLRYHRRELQYEAGHALRARR